MSHVAIRLERAKDRDAAVEVERRTFASDEEHGIVEALRDEDGSFTLVAEEDGAVVGHVRCSRARAGDDDVVAFGPIGVLPERQGMGIGSAPELGMQNLDAGLREGDFEIYEEDFQITELGPEARALSAPCAGTRPSGSPVEAPHPRG